MPKLSLAKLERHLYAAADRLRQEGLDAATYKDFIFGMLFLKRCSDVFEAERDKIVGRRVEQGMIREVAETQYGENADFYDSFWLFAIIWAEPKSFHNRLISVFSGCVHFATQRPAVESASSCC